MGVYINDKLQRPVEHESAKEAAAKAAEQWRKDHADDVAVEPVFDETTGRQTNFMSRTEQVVVEAATYKITQYSDGTIRTDSRLPPAPKPAPITVDSKYSYSAGDMAQLHSKEGKLSVQVSDKGKGMAITGPATEPQPEQPTWFKSSPRESRAPREEFGDSFRR